MDYTTLGRTGLEVSVAGLGTGGGSRLGMKTGKTQAQSVALIHAALDLGITLVDTAEQYGTEAIVGAALKTVPRDKRSEEHTSELQSLVGISYAVFCLDRKSVV